jgi:predicted HicB family RNase H-like nuclease
MKTTTDIDLQEALAFRMPRNLKAALKKRAESEGKALAVFIREILIDATDTVIAEPKPLHAPQRSFTFPMELIAKLTKGAKRRHISVGDYVQRLLEQSLDGGGK